MDERSTTLSTRLVDEPRDIRLVEVDLRGISGIRLLGRRTRLSFVSKLTFVGEDTYSKANPVFDLSAEITVSKDMGGPPRLLGRARLSEPAFVVPNANDPRAWTRRAELQLDLDSRQIDELEELRDGSGLWFWLALDGIVHLPTAVGRLNPAGRLGYGVGQSDWITLLNQIQYGTHISIEVAVPAAGDLHGDLAVAAKALQNANEAFRRGAYEEAVADCRDGLDALIRLAGGRPQAKFGDHSLTKNERLVYVETALLNLANLAHHPNDPTSAAAGSTDWVRHDAQAAITILAALTRRAAA